MSNTTFKLPGKVLLLALCALISTGATAENTKENDESVVVAGKARFIDACAFCHGLAGTGNGMAAGMLDTLPADLTLLRKNNDGQFPLLEIYTVIDGRSESSSHGTRAMPVWGDVWSQNAPPELADYNVDSYADYYVKGRILELIMFLESIQM